MAIYLRKFETVAQYTAAQSSLILPNVSLVTENNTVHYSPLQPTPPSDLSLVCRYNITDTSEATNLFEYNDYIRVETQSEIKTDRIRNKNR